jgi:hypothetical protein
VMGHDKSKMIKCSLGLTRRVGALEDCQLDRCWLTGHPRAHPNAKDKEEGHHVLTIIFSQLPSERGNHVEDKKVWADASKRVSNRGGLGHGSYSDMEKGAGMRRF